MVLGIIFWFFLLSIIYCYFGYPFLLLLATKLMSRPVKKSPQQLSVTVLLAVWNEEDVIVSKLNNLLSLNYPTNAWKIIIGSDGSDDKTCELIKGLNSDRIQLVDSGDRRGKMVVLNDLMGRVESDIVVFCDARQDFEQNAIVELASNFSDPLVGCVSGELIFRDQEGGTARGVNFYWRYEKFMRACESAIHSMLGATGAIYAIRAELYHPIPIDVILDDMYVPLKIIQKGYRAIFDGTAKAYDDVANNPAEEHQRKTRTLFGNYQIFGLFKIMFNPKKSPIAVQLFSHKLLRVIVPFFLIFVFVLNLFLLDQILYQMIFSMQLLFYVMAALGCLARNKKCVMLKPLLKVCHVAYVFCLLNFSALNGFLRFIFASQKVTWNKARKST